MKKVSVLVLMIFLSVFLTACSGEDNISITGEESDAIAQYCAHLLIKYDKNHRDGIRLLDIKDLNDELKARKKAEEEEYRRSHPSPTPTPSEAPTEAPDPEASPTPDITEPDVTVTPTPEPDAASIAEAGGIEGFAIDYQKYGIADSYTNTGEYYSFSAPAGKKLCVIEFAITNTSDTDAQFIATDHGLTYRLTCEGNKVHGSEISLFGDDIQFYNSIIKAGESAHATLIFYVSEDETPLYLEVQGEKKYTINLK